MAEGVLVEWGRLLGGGVVVADGMGKQSQYEEIRIPEYEIVNMETRIFSGAIALELSTC